MEPLADTWSQEAADFFLQRAQAGRLATTVLAYEPSQPLVAQVKVKIGQVVQIEGQSRGCLKVCLTAFYVQLMVRDEVEGGEHCLGEELVARGWARKTHEVERRECSGRRVIHIPG